MRLARTRRSEYSRELPLRSASVYMIEPFDLMRGECDMLSGFLVLDNGTTETSEVCRSILIDHRPRLDEGRLYDFRVFTLLDHYQGLRFRFRLVRCR